LLSARLLPLPASPRPCVPAFPANLPPLPAGPRSCLPAFPASLARLLARMFAVRLLVRLLATLLARPSSLVLLSMPWARLPRTPAQKPAATSVPDPNPAPHGHCTARGSRGCGGSWIWHLASCRVQPDSSAPRDTAPGSQGSRALSRSPARPRSLSASLRSTRHPRPPSWSLHRV
jgi:hypothetical protein